MMHLQIDQPVIIREAHAIRFPALTRFSARGAPNFGTMVGITKDIRKCPRNLGDSNGKSISNCMAFPRHDSRAPSQPERFLPIPEQRHFPGR
ncbi:MAG: hypothetical protein HYU74_03110 [Dechloromonas sp.]|nr:hypothetical protein [Dechloromonas sp.]